MSGVTTNHCAVCFRTRLLTYECPVCGQWFCAYCTCGEPDPCCTGEPHDPSLNDGEDFET